LPRLAAQARRRARGGSLPRSAAARRGHALGPHGPDHLLAAVARFIFSQSTNVTMPRMPVSRVGIRGIVDATQTARSPVRAFVLPGWAVTGRPSPPILPSRTF